MKVLLLVITSLFLANICLLEIGASKLNSGSAENELDGNELNPIDLKSPASELHDEIDILKLINLIAKGPGVALVEGPVNKYPAYKFRLPFGNVPLNNSTEVTSAMSGESGFTVVFLYRQQKNNIGTLLSINSPGRLTPWFQISSNCRTGLLSVKYRINASSRLRQVDWNLPNHQRKSPLAAWTWISLTSDFITGTLRLDLDCQPSKFESLDTNNEKTHIRIPQDSLVYFGQEPGRKKKFLGSMQVAKVIPYTLHQRLWSCMDIAENSKPEHRKPMLKNVN